MANENIKKPFGARLKMLRKNKRLTQKELALKLDIGLSQYNKYECGLYIPPAEKLIKLSEVFDVTIDYLLTGHENDLSLNNLRLLKRFQALENFQNDDQEAIIRLIDAVIVKNRAEDIFDISK
jgi:transcriptional regulator with XRE-family HTH domain